MTNFATILTESLNSSPEQSMSRSARALRSLVKGYQYLHAGRPSPCRYYPSCSVYAVEALEIHGALKGMRLATWRVLRCNPFGSHGIDLVPLPKKKENPE